jgi:CHAT domain-containing protein
MPEWSPSAGGHPDLETLAAFADGKVPVPERDAIVAHLAGCEDCFELVSELMASSGATSAGGPREKSDPPGGSGAPGPPLRVVPFNGRRGIVWGAAVLATAAAVVLTVRIQPQWFGGRPADTAFERLVEAVGTERTVEGRMTGGFAYGELRGASRSAVGTSTPNYGLLAAVGELQKRAESDSDPEVVHAYGVGLLAAGQAAEATKVLESAAAMRPGDPRILSDIAAAKIASATGPTQARVLTEAIDAAQRAIRADDVLEAHFNLALALEKLGASGPARQAWDEYLRRDTASPWAEEARRRRARLESSRADCRAVEASDAAGIAGVARECPQRFREFLENTLLADWAKLEKNDDPAAGAALERLGRYAEVLRAANGESMPRDGVAAIVRAGAGDRRLLAGAHAALLEGQTHYDSDQRPLAIPLLHRASRDLRRLGSPYWLWSEHYLARIDSNRRDHRAALDRLDLIRTRSAAYQAISARETWLRGVIALQQGQLADALQHYRRAATAYASIGEQENQASVLNTQADTERILGEIQAGWLSLGRALSRVDSVSDPTRRYLMFFNAALFSAKEQLLSAALLFQSAALEQAEQRLGPAAKAEGLINRALLYARTGDVDAGMRDLGAAVLQLPLLSDGAQRAYMEARLSAVRGEMGVLARDGDARADLERARTFFARSEPAELPRLHWLAAQASLNARQPEAAESFLQKGVEIFEARLSALANRPYSISYFDEGWNLYQTQIEMAVADSNSERALTLVEHTRSRDLISRLPGMASVPRDVRQLASSVPAGATAVFYVVVDTRIVAWTVSAHGIEMTALDSPAGDVTAAVRRIESGNEQSRRLALKELHALLIEPLGLGASELLVIIPDGFLFAVPFQALVDADGRYLVEKQAIAIAPSLRHFVWAAATLPRRDVRSAVVVAEPAVDTRRHPTLSPLPWARAEGQEIARIYPDATLLEGSAATRSAVLTQILHTDVVHFAGHSIANEDFPNLSRLVVAPAEAESSADEIYASDLSGVRSRASIVVLASCESAKGATRRGEGAMSLARALLAAGVPAIVASIWPVDDTAASQLLPRLHSELRTGASPASALRRAQLAAIQDGLRISAWAGFAVYGGS